MPSTLANYSTLRRRAGPAANFWLCSTSRINSVPFEYVLHQALWKTDLLMYTFVRIWEHSLRTPRISTTKTDMKPDVQIDFVPRKPHSHNNRYHTILFIHISISYLIPKYSPTIVLVIKCSASYKEIVMTVAEWHYYNLNHISCDLSTSMTGSTIMLFRSIP